MNDKKIIAFMEWGEYGEYELDKVVYWISQQSIEECYLDWLESSNVALWDRKMDFYAWCHKKGWIKPLQYESIKGSPDISAKNQARYKKILLTLNVHEESPTS